MSRIAQTLFGNVAPRLKGRDLLLVAVPWLLADVVTKYLALWLLAERDLRFLGGQFRLHLSLNESLFGSGQNPSRFGITHAMVVGAALMQGVFAGAGFAFGRAEWTVIRKLILLGLVVIVGAGLGFFLGSFFAGEPHRLVVHAARAFGSLTILLLALRLTRSRYLGLALALGISGNLGNAINALYYPRGVIDFMYVPGFHPYIGIFNLSDVALELAKGLVLLSPLMLVLFRQVSRRSAAWEHRLEYVNQPEPPSMTIPS
jgi:lipoprotein signal peptidase